MCSATMCHYVYASNPLSHAPFDTNASALATSNAPYKLIM